ncbi:DnaJ-like protein [Roseibium hamelinense]|uniref:DnaJ-like protein n=1 Tax=Roseibium hamelinense TaxID=150831 RepID=A0A562SF67_9HYPH|nr:DnaJ domain-containing protein [Roseibium hamelinense]MTI44191.1 molecular chaperone DnaJ [Roseibium hamelinense]TWI80025.1 DnaJ-like protein [Roseibium hamelinense]
MVFLLIGVLALILFLFVGNSFVHANPADLARLLRRTGGVVLMLLAAFLAITGRIAFAIPAAAIGLSLLGLGGLGRMTGFPGLGSGQPSGGQKSRVRSAMVEMELDHDSGAMNGTVLTGMFEGRELDTLSEAELKALWQEADADGQSRALIEAYLDRRLASWREDFEADGTDRQGGPASAGPMTDEEAYQILGLSPGAGDAEVRAAHRRLMKRLHPDHGGTTFLAAKLNEAKDRLLRRH